MRKSLIWGSFVALLSAACGFITGSWWAERNTLPPLQTVVVQEAALEFVARLDTGATVSSINA